MSGLGFRVWAQLCCLFKESAKQAAAAVPRQMQRSLGVITDVSLSLCSQMLRQKAGEAQVKLDF